MILRILPRRPKGCSLVEWIICLTTLIAPVFAADEIQVEQIGLPPLQIDGSSARAHTQGLDWSGRELYVTARLDEPVPKRALLLRTAPGRDHWDSWDITAGSGAKGFSKLDHPGGFQSDGKRLWIPVAESRRHGTSSIRVFRIESLTAGRRADPEFEFPVEDHIGAVAVSTGRRLILGASWDTETVYVWDLAGQLQRKLAGVELTSRGLGAVDGEGGRSGVTVQDWKWVGRNLYAGGLFRAPGRSVELPASRWMKIRDFLEPSFREEISILPMQPPLGSTAQVRAPSNFIGTETATVSPATQSRGVELSHEGMSVRGRWTYFLPEDLAASNRLFRVPLHRLRQLRVK